MHWLLRTLIIGTIPGLSRHQPAHSSRAEGRFVLLSCPPQCLPSSFCEEQDSPMRWGHASDPWAPVRITWRAWALRWQAPSRDFSRFEYVLQTSTQVILLLLFQARTLRTPVLEWSGGKVTRGELLRCAGRCSLVASHSFHSDFHRAVRGAWLTQPNRGMGVILKRTRPSLSLAAPPGGPQPWFSHIFRREARVTCAPSLCSAAKQWDAA